ncbi:MAG TPA: ATP-binding protein [Nocardioidaceae bacterium]|nr:ATP-binding protein [Nocardioidaceae bacterium]
MRAADSVRDRVIMLLLSTVMLVTVVAGAGAIGVTSLTEDVDVLVDDLRPAAYSNIALRNDMSRAQASARGWALTGDDSFLRTYRTSVLDAHMELAQLRSLVEDEEELAAAVAQQTDAADRWFSFADGLVRREPGPVPVPYLLDGQVTFERFVALNDRISFKVNDGIDERGEQARGEARHVIVFVVLASLLGTAATALVGRAIVRRTSEPLRELERAVERLAAGDLSARVDVSGPREIRGVATALNTLAEENQRAREMEERVVTQLRQLDRAKDEFVSTVSHELRTPLTSIAGYIELFEDSFDDLGPQQRGMLGVVSRNVGRLRNLIEDLLTLSRVEADAFRTSFDLVDLGQVTVDVARDVAEIAARADVQVEVSGPETPVWVRGQAGQLARATLNLVTNAIKFSMPGDEVEVCLDVVADQAVVSVVDHGIGIPAQELSTLGTRFFRASNAVEAEITGTGLGLRIVQTIADNHGGRLEIDSVEGEGTTARLVFPVTNDQHPGNIPQLEDITEG